MPFWVDFDITYGYLDDTAGAELKQSCTWIADLSSWQPLFKTKHASMFGNDFNANMHSEYVLCLHFNV